MKRVLAPVVVMVALSGCDTLGLKNMIASDDDAPAGYELEDPRLARDITPFDHFLYEGYRIQAKKEDREHDFADVERYLAKASAAGSGKLVSPDLVSDRELPEYAVAELSTARERLDDAFYAGASVKQPEQAAMAQVMFDCWMEQQEENIQPHHIEECKSRFEQAMSRLGEELGLGRDAKAQDCVPPAETMPVSSAAADVTVPAPQPTTPATVYQGPYTIYFDLNSAEINGDGWLEVVRIRDDVEKLKPARIILKGHTDTSGSKMHNEALSDSRVQAVNKALRKMGVSVAIMRQTHYGEDTPKIATADGVRHPQNRRVEVALEW